MFNWPFRYQLGIKRRLRRSLYEVLRDQMDNNLIKLSLIDSYKKFQAAGEPYPFVPKKDLKPRARVIGQEYTLHNRFLVLFCEGSIPSVYKKYIRFFDTNKISKDAIEKMPFLTLHKRYTSNLGYFDNPNFCVLVNDLTAIDYALLIQNEPTAARNRYRLTHFHVKIDWPVDYATEEMAQELRYIAKDLYERDEKYAEHLHHKLFEKYGFHHSAGGRRTAAVVAAQFLKKMPFISTVYISSSEARTLTKISERGVRKYALVKIPISEIDRLAQENQISFDCFVERYLFEMSDDFGVGILNVVYRDTPNAKPPEDGKLRKLRPDYQWLNVHDQLLVPLTDEHDAQPVRYQTIYSPDFGDETLG